MKKKMVSAKKSAKKNAKKASVKKDRKRKVPTLDPKVDPKVFIYTLERIARALERLADCAEENVRIEKAFT